MKNFICIHTSSMHWNVCMTQEKLKRIQDIILLLNRQVRGKKKLSNELTEKMIDIFFFLFPHFSHQCIVSPSTWICIWDMSFCDNLFTVFYKHEAKNKRKEGKRMRRQEWEEERKTTHWRWGVLRQMLNICKRFYSQWHFSISSDVENEIRNWIKWNKWRKKSTFALSTLLLQRQWDVQKFSH